MSVPREKPDTDPGAQSPRISKILPRLDEPMDDATWNRLRGNAQTASDFLKAISHEGRLMILCALANGEKSVAEIETMLSSRQAAVSQQLSRLRSRLGDAARGQARFITFMRLTGRREHRNAVYELFCPERGAEDGRARRGKEIGRCLIYLREGWSITVTH